MSDPGFCAGTVSVAESGLRTIRPFALPRKRFVKQVLVEKATTYLGTGASYRTVVRHDALPVMYDTRPSDAQNPRSLRGSTVWRWLSWLEGLSGTLRAAWGLVRQKEPGATVHREPWALSPAKYRSAGRRDTLQQAMQLIAVGQLFERLFDEEIFPRFATAHGWS
jgi:hypothetical protein